MTLAFATNAICYRFLTVVADFALHQSVDRQTVRGQCLFEAGRDVGWDKWRFAARPHEYFATIPDGGPYAVILANARIQRVQQETIGGKELDSHLRGNVKVPTSSASIRDGGPLRIVLTIVHSEYVNAFTRPEKQHDPNCNRAIGVVWLCREASL